MIPYVKNNILRYRWFLERITVVIENFFFINKSYLQCAFVFLAQCKMLGIAILPSVLQNFLCNIWLLSICSSQPFKSISIANWYGKVFVLDKSLKKKNCKANVQKHVMRIGTMIGHFLWYKTNTCWSLLR